MAVKRWPSIDADGAAHRRSDLGMDHHVGVLVLLVRKRESFYAIGAPGGPVRAGIAALQAELAHLQSMLTDAGLYGRDPKAFAAASARLGAAQAELDAAETEWLELEMLREELQG